MYSHEQLKLMDAAAISISSQRHIQSVIEELIETALAAAPTPAEIPATTNPAQISSLPAEAPEDVARDAEYWRNLINRTQPMPVLQAIQASIDAVMQEKGGV